MSGGLLALLDDVAALAKASAASLDDMATQALQSGAKATTLVIDDTTVVPGYVQGIPPSRELPIVGRIALGSLRNKLVFLLPAALVLGAFAPWAVMPLLMLGGFYLAYEAAEKIVGAVEGGGHDVREQPMSEDRRVSRAVQTDFILSAEIMAITLQSVAETPSWTQAAVLGGVGAAMTALVYGVVALIVKTDDAGLALARSSYAPVRAIGRGMVKGLPAVMQALTGIGTAAMGWVAGSIILHGLGALGWTAPGRMVEQAAGAAGGFGWLVGTGADLGVGLIAGLALRPAWARVARMRR